MLDDFGQMVDQKVNIWPKSTIGQKHVFSFFGSVNEFLTMNNNFLDECMWLVFQVNTIFLQIFAFENELGSWMNLELWMKLGSYFVFEVPLTKQAMSWIQ